MSCTVLFCIAVAPILPLYHIFSTFLVVNMLMSLLYPFTLTGLGVCRLPLVAKDDHPADANYYFSSGEQGRCYLAPERFHSAPQTNEDSRSAGGGGATATTVASGSATSDGGVSDVAGGYPSGAGSRPGPGRGGGLEGLVGCVFTCLCETFTVRSQSIR